eukprot:Gregarina_sp_Pseudo_9__2494@NODE_2773_length_878_cov_62_890346_g2538_i0_p1_GENE_NODE_2773_length_878_cov_62_890346_g2538_i0NODE_2773_length_878_cov_62_890346_g2538_i0_p1_ORF_typecomplete_len214_score40_34EMP24_GP25L/PF01105_24/3_5e26BBS2_C/PF14782_6/0_034DUF4307/PF14155_6/0_35DUF4307/PF14155_6/3_4e03_NODE_2773_length_878_cov_62_890346_g2538_i0152793
MRRLLVNLLALLVLRQANSQALGKAFFYVAEGSSKCFYENIPQGLPMTVQYESQDNPGVACSLTIQDADKREVAKKEVERHKPMGKLVHLSQRSGEHSICVSCPSSKWFGSSMIKWSIAVDLGDTEIDLTAAAKGHAMESNERLIRTLTQRIQYLHAENTYHEEEEAKLQQDTEKVGVQFALCSLLQMLVMAASTVFAVSHLSKHFKAQKLTT